jgi:hypothetical protein
VRKVISSFRRNYSRVCADTYLATRLIEGGQLRWFHQPTVSNRVGDRSSSGCQSPWSNGIPEGRGRASHKGVRE